MPYCRTQAYFNTDIISDNCHRDDVPLLTNCCGLTQFSKEYREMLSPIHRFDHYLMCIISGELNATINGTKYILKGGSCICIPPLTQYSYFCVSDEPVKYYWVHFTGSEATEMLSSLGLPILTHLQLCNTPIIEDIYEKLFFEFRNRSKNFRYRAAILLQMIILQLSTNYEISTTSTNPLDSTLRYIHTHLGSNLSIRTLAEREFLSISYYRAIFNKHMGCSPTEYISTLRINRACQLLTETTQSIESIANEVGITDRLYFQRFFKKRTGTTPNKYRCIHKSY